MTDPSQMTIEQMNIIFPIKMVEIDWGSLRGRKQGKRSGGMVVGGMADVTIQGKKRYVDWGSTYGLTDKTEIMEVGSLQGVEILAYRQARTAGWNHDDAMCYVYEQNEG